MPNIPTMSLKTAPIQFAEFKPVQYTPQIADNTLLAKSLLTQEARAKEARTTLGNTDNLLAGIKNAINPEEYNWFENQANDIRKKIDDQISLGNTETAIRFAQEAGRDLARSKDMHNKIHANAVYQQELNRIKNGAFSNITKRRWEDSNKYYDDGTGNWTAKNFIPVADMSVADVWARAVASTPTRSNTKGSSRSNTSQQLVDTNGRPINATTKETIDGKTSQIVSNNVSGPLTTTTSSSSWSSGYTSKSKEDIMNIFNDLMSDSNILAGVKQQYDNLVWLYDKSKSIIDDPNSTPEQIKQAKADLFTAQSSLEDKDGFIHKNGDYFKTWVQKQADRYAQHSQFRNTNTNNSTNNSTTYGNVFSDINTTRTQNLVEQYSPGAEGTVTGPSITVKRGLGFPNDKPDNSSGYNVSMDATDYNIYF